ncbi:MAG: thermosome subunit beta [Candidatus Syntropharchaeia archaeon]
MEVDRLEGIPVLILREGTQRIRGREAQENNINAAKLVASAVRTTLGPRGMDKMLVDFLGDVTITNDGVTILKEMEIEHPAAKMMVEVAKAQEDVAGDGTTTAVILAGELLKEAEELMIQDVHPTVITHGFRLAAEKTREILEDIAMEIDIENEEPLLKIAKTSITGKGAEAYQEKISTIAVKAIKSIAEEIGGKNVVDVDYISVEKKVGKSVADAELVDGMIIDKERVHPDMPKRIENAKIALINASMEVKDPEVDTEIAIRSPEQLKLFLAEEEKTLKEMVEKIRDSGANVVFCQKGMDDLVQYYLAKAGILGVRRVKKSDMEKLSRATGAKVIMNIDEIDPDDLGSAGLVEERKIGDDRMIFVTKCKNPKSVSILVRGGTEHLVDEMERAIHDALRVVGVAIEDGKVVAGGGSPEVELSLKLKDYASTLKGREQLAVEAFANALDIVPRTLAENAGLDPIDKLVELRSEHEKGTKTAGLDVYTGNVVDMYELGVMEPLRVKAQAVKSAAESAIMILRIDDVIAAKKIEPPKGGEEMPPEGMPGSPPGGMPGMM